MKSARFEFDQNLRPLLRGDRRGGDFEYVFSGPQSVKHLIESADIPHTEIGKVQVGDQTVGLDYLVQDGDHIRVQAAHPPNDKGGEPRFVLDGHLGRLASHLRMLGMDCLYRSDVEDQELAKLSLDEGRALLTRDRRLLMRKTVTSGYLLRSLDPHEQFQEVVKRFHLKKWIRPFQRCIRCNHLLEPIDKEAIIDRLEPLTRRYFQEFHICPACGQIYWKGSHYERMQKFISDMQ